MSDDDVTELVSAKAFDVGEIPDEMDLSKPPSSGLEYLRRVKYEVLRTPEVVCVPIDPAKVKQPQVCEMRDNDTEPAPPGFAPTVKWQREQVMSFSRIRNTLVKQKHRFKNEKSVELPNIKDQAAWCLFCLGLSPSGKQNGENSAATARSVVCEVTSDAYPPLLSVLVPLIHPDIERLLSYHIRWLNEFGFSHHQGRWIYALLASLVKPLTPETCHLLRGLARACWRLRRELENKEHEFLKPLNLLICLVANYFDQKDMGDDDNIQKEDEEYLVGEEVEEDNYEEVEDEYDEEVEDEFDEEEVEDEFDEEEEEA